MTVRYVHCGYLTDILLEKTQHTDFYQKISPSSQILKMLMLWEEQSVRFKCRNYNLRKEKKSSIKISWYCEFINAPRAICSLVKAVRIFFFLNPPQRNLSSFLDFYYDAHNFLRCVAVISCKNVSKTPCFLSREEAERLNRQFWCGHLMVSTGCCRSSQWGDSTGMGGSQGKASWSQWYISWV